MAEDTTDEKTTERKKQATKSETIGPDTAVVPPASEPVDEQSKEPSKSRRSKKTLFIILIVMSLVLAYLLYSKQQATHVSQVKSSSTQQADPVSHASQTNDIASSKSNSVAATTAITGLPDDILGTDSTQNFDSRGGHVVSRLGVIGDGKKPIRENTLYVTGDEFKENADAMHRLHQELLSLIQSTNQQNEAKFQELSNQLTQLKSQVAVADALANKSIDLQSQSGTGLNQRLSQIEGKMAAFKEQLTNFSVSATTIANASIPQAQPITRTPTVPFKLFTIELWGNGTPYAICTKSDEMFTITVGESVENWRFEKIDHGATEVHLVHVPSGTKRVLKGS